MRERRFGLRVSLMLSSLHPRAHFAHPSTLVNCDDANLGTGGTNALHGVSALEPFDADARTLVVKKVSHRTVTAASHEPLIRARVITIAVPFIDRRAARSARPAGARLS